MDHSTIPETGGITSELVWDAELHGIAKVPPDTAVTVGLDEGVPPDSLLAAAADAALMVEFLHRAVQNGLEVFGYVSATRFEPPAEGGELELLVLLPSVLVHDGDVDRAEVLLQEAFHAAPVLRRLGDSLLLEGSIQPVAAVEPEP